MKHFIVSMFLVLASNFSVAGTQDKCAAISSDLAKSYGRAVPCYCGNDLSNLEITPPAGLQVYAACDLREGSGRWIDLKKEKASLDYYTKQGDMPNGHIYLTGQIIRTGIVSMEPDNGGELYFTTKCDLPDEPAFIKRFCSFKLGRDADYVELKGPKPSYKPEMKCWSSEATLRIINPIVSIDDSDGAGTSPSKIVALKKTKPVFSKCYE